MSAGLSKDFSLIIRRRQKPDTLLLAVDETTKNVYFVIYTFKGFIELKNGITKEQSKCLQGLAILMMLYHHLFATPEALGVDYLSLLRFGGFNAELRLAYFCKLCVGIYAFVSGYGLCRALNRTTHNRFFTEFRYEGGFFQKLGADYRIALQKLKSFYLQFLLVFVLFVPVGFFFFHRSFVWSEWLLNLLGLSASYNGAWWYILQYYKMLLTLPLLDCFFTWFGEKKARWAQLVFYAGVLLLLILLRVLPVSSLGISLQNGQTNLLAALLEWFQPAFYLCFVVGYVLARFRVYELFETVVAYAFRKSKEPKERTELALNLLGAAAFLLVIACRVKIAKDASSAGLDFLFTPVFAFGFLRILEWLPALKRPFLFFGTYSVYIWLTHVFFYDHYAKPLVMASHVSALIYLTLLALSMGSAVLLACLYKKLEKILRKGKR